MLKIKWREAFVFFLFILFFIVAISSILDYPLPLVGNIYKYLNPKLPLFIYFGTFFFFSTIFSFFFLSFLGLYGVFLLNFVALFLFWYSLILYFNFIIKDQIFFKIFLFNWLHLNQNFNIHFTILIDLISFSFVFLTTTIAVFVYLYTFSYFRYEPLVDRFLLFINFFVISMIFLVISSNFIMLFLGWELIGLSSFFLINFWTTRVATLKAGFKAYVLNKVSDFFLFFFIIIVYNTIYDLDIITFNSTIHMYSNYYVNLFIFHPNLLEFMSFFILICSFIKSAQIGFHIWLPDSMEAPVPASALIHSATLVSAGIFLILRLMPLFELTTYSYIIIICVGSLTAMYGGFVAMFTSDIKRILAYSTISHCGFLMILSALFFNEYTILYLYVHGFFKASVFLCVGNVIRFSKNYQDFRFMGGFYKYLPFDCLISFICLFNLAGLPFGLGFYIKHLLFLSLNNNFLLYYFVLFNCIVGAISGIFYSYRLFYNVFFDFKKAKKQIYISSNKINFFSKFYSNSSLGSNVSIGFLIFFSYIICFRLFSDYLCSSNQFNDSLNLLYFTNYININFATESFLFNLSFFNYIILFFCINIVYYFNRNIFNSYIILYYFIIIITFTFFFIFFYFNLFI